MGEGRKMEEGWRERDWSEGVNPTELTVPSEGRSVRLVPTKGSIRPPGQDNFRSGPITFQPTIWATPSGEPSGSALRDLS